MEKRGKKIRFSVHNKTMKKLRNFIAWCKGKYALLAEKKYTTIP